MDAAYWNETMMWKFLQKFRIVSFKGKHDALNKVAFISMIFSILFN